MAFPCLSLQSLDERMARRRADHRHTIPIAGRRRVVCRGCVKYGARLVTLDAEQLERAPALVEACKPDVATRLLKATLR